MAMRSTVLYLLCAVLLLRSFGNAQTENSTAQVLPARLYNGYLVVVQGSIGSLEKRNFAIDTGAYPSIVDRSVAKKLHLLRKNEELRVVDHNINSQTTFVPELSVGPIRAKNLKVVVQDLTSISETLGVRIDALIGLDLLVYSSFRIDYREKKLVFGPVDPLPMAAPMRWTDRMVCVDLKVNDQLAHLVVDTGAASLLLFGQRLPWTARYSGDARGYSNLGGRFTLREVKANSLALAGNELGAGRVFISNAQNMTPFHFDGLLATGALPFRQIAFDFERQQLGWEPASSRADDVRRQATTDARVAALSFAAAAPASQFPVPGQCTSNGVRASGCGESIPLRPVSSR
jgi:hypothetical protein